LDQTLHKEFLKRSTLIGYIRTPSKNQFLLPPREALRYFDRYTALAIDPDLDYSYFNDKEQWDFDIGLFMKYTNSAIDNLFGP